VNDVSIFERTLAWDHAAGVLFLNEAGGKAARFDGTPYRVDEDRKGLIGASSPALWDELARGWRGFDLRLRPLALVLVNARTVHLFWQDKRYAREGRRRIPESSLC
jgi:hypothetical protein